MARSLWTGSLSFGLVNIPIKLYNAVSPKDIRFHLLHDKDGVRIQQKRVCPADGEEVSADHLVKGYEIAPDQYVKITKEELENIDPKTTHTVDIEDFVGLDQIDPIYYEHTYYVVPQPTAANAYALLLAAMKKSNKVAIARIVMRTKQYLTALRPRGDVLMLSTLLFSDEVVSTEALSDLPAKDIDVNPRQLTMAEQLIESLSTDFTPEKYHDEYRERVLQLIERKAEGEDVVTQPPPKEGAKVINLMDALEASLAETKRRAARGSKPEGGKRKRKA